MSAATPDSRLQPFACDSEFSDQSEKKKKMKPPTAETAILSIKKQNKYLHITQSSQTKENKIIINGLSRDIRCRLAMIRIYQCTNLV